MIISYLRTWQPEKMNKQQNKNKNKKYRIESLDRAGIINVSFVVSLSSKSLYGKNLWKMLWVVDITLKVINYFR